MRATIILVLILKTIYCIGQSPTPEHVKNLNFIITIDEQVVIGSIQRLRIIAFLNNGGKTEVEAEYFPGNLSLKQSDYDVLITDSVKTIFVAFNYLEYCSEQQNSYTYEIEIHKGWLEHYYYVLNIFNTDKKKYRKVFDPIEGKSYTFEIDYPGGSVKRIRKKALINDCN